MESGIVGGELKPSSGIPVAAGVNKVDAMTGVDDHFSLVMNLDFMIDRGIEGLCRDDEQELIA